MLRWDERWNSPPPYFYGCPRGARHENSQFNRTLLGNRHTTGADCSEIRRQTSNEPSSHAILTLFCFDLFCRWSEPDSSEMTCIILKSLLGFNLWRCINHVDSLFSVNFNSMHIANTETYAFSIFLSRQVSLFKLCCRAALPNDMALLELETPATLNERVAVIPLPRDDSGLSEYPPEHRSFGDSIPAPLHAPGKYAVGSECRIQNDCRPVFEYRRLDYWATIRAIVLSRRLNRQCFLARWIIYLEIFGALRCP